MKFQAGVDFMHRTYRSACSPTPQSQGVPEPPLEIPIPEGAELIDLPLPDEIHLNPTDLRKIMEQRATLRKYSPAGLSMNELAYLLWLTQGVKQVTEKPVTYRIVPSAGSRHAFETYLLVNRVEGLKPGLYRYAAIEHKLLSVKQDDELTEKMVEATYKQTHVRASAVTFLWAAVVERIAWRYVERSYRYLHLDAGHVCQNLYLAAESIDCGVCAIAAFDDEMVNSLLELDGDEQFVIYMASIGKK
ncbi:MAG: SagB/ThcOx family dehydrogenase [Anaerolineaceae bacterium]